MSTATSLTKSQFLELLQKCQLLTPDALASYLAQFESEPAEDTTNPVKLAHLMIRDGLLTRYQAKCLLSGKPRRFFLAGKFKILEPLRQGGMGAVFLCEHLLMKRLVAIKIVNAKQVSDPSLLERFLRESRAVAALDHPNLVRAYDADRDHDLYYLVMEFIDGVSLHDWVQRQGPLQVDQACLVIAQAAVGLQHAFEAGWVHRDIKPGNILVDCNGLVKLLDMGLARLFDDSKDLLTKKYDDKATLGTADYLSPEQAMDISQVDIRGDLYSLGATFYYLLVGQAPFADRVNTAQKLVAHQMLHPLPLPTWRNDLPAPLVSVIEKLMAKNPEERFQTPIELKEALQPWLTSPLRPPPVDIMPRWCKAITDLAGRSDPRITQRVQAHLSTITNQSQLTRTLALTPRPSSTSDSIKAPQAAALSSGKMVRAKAKLAKERPHAQQLSKPKRRTYASVWIAAGMGGGMLSLAILLIVLFWPNADRADKRDRWVSPAKSSTSPFQSPSTPSGLQSSAPGSKMDPGLSKQAPQYNLASTVFVADPPTLAPSGATRVQATVREALTLAKPGETVVVLSDRIVEPLILENGLLGKRVTLSGLKPDGSYTLWQPPATWSKKAFIHIANTEAFTLRGFRLDGNDDQVDAIMEFQGRCPGLRLEQLHLTQFKRTGIVLSQVEGEADDPLQFRQLRFESGKKNQRHAAIFVQAEGDLESRHILIHDCRFDGFFQSMIRIEGSANGITIRNNRFLILPQSAKKSDKIHRPSDAFTILPGKSLRLTISNNTFLRFNNGINLETLPPNRPENRIAFRNNLILNMQACVSVEQSNSSSEDAALAQLFQPFEGNLCRPNNCTRGVSFLKPTVRDDIDRLADDAEQDAVLLRYSRNSKLSSAGAGNEPVGAPPVGWEN